MNDNGDCSSADRSDFEATRHEMVARQICDRGIQSARILQAMETTPRHLFVPSAHISAAYSDEPLSIGEGQTISQPFMVAAMAEALLLQGTERVLEVGAGSGYQAAVLSRLARDVITIESCAALAMLARERLARLGYTNVHVETGDGSLGWPLNAPYEAILVTAAAPAVPPPLLEQLSLGGRLVIPVGSAQHQELIRMARRESHTTEESLYACRFVPMTGHYGWPTVSMDSMGG